MLRVLYLTAELPYFPGQGGLMHLLVRHLAANGEVGVVGPKYGYQPAAAIADLRSSLTASYFWPEPANPGELPVSPELKGRPRNWLNRLPRSCQRIILERATGLHRQSPEALAWLAVLNNLAPQLLEAIRRKEWQVVLLAQSTSAIWARHLPASLATCVYFHDVRSDYLRRSAPGAGSWRDRRRRTREERDLLPEVDAAAFVSDLDLTRAARLSLPTCANDVIPVCIDPEYFAFTPVVSGDARPPLVLFTGHLAHPPNVDAALYFLKEIWPLVLKEYPQALCRIAGHSPSDAVRAAAATASQVELRVNVADMRDEFAASRVFVVPMRYGGGVRQKILESWACGVPVVTTSMGAEGLDAINRANCWIEDQPARFAHSIVDLLQNGAPHATLNAARQLIDRAHVPAVSGPRTERLLQAAIRRRRDGPAKILFDLRWMEIGKAGGIEQMTHELVGEIAKVDQANEFRVLGPRRTCLEWDFPRTFQSKFEYTDGMARHWTSLRNSVVTTLADNLGLPPLTSPALTALKQYRELDFTVVHSFPSYTHPDLLGFPSVLTMHDLQHLHLPEFFSPEDIATRERHYRESCAAADRIICVSEFTRMDVHRRYGVPLDRLVTIWNLPSRTSSRPMGRLQRDRLLTGMEINRPFVFFPAHAWLHKNHQRLLDAFAIALPRLPKGCQLLLTGRPPSSDHPAAAALAAMAEQGSVRHLGFRTPLEMAALLRSAEALIFPSLFEGFGMPVIEAMLADCPVACADNSSLPEIADEAALLFDARSESAIADALVRITADDVLRTRLREAGRNRTSSIDRSETARRTIEIYRQIHETHFS